MPQSLDLVFFKSLGRQPQFLLRIRGLLSQQPADRPLEHVGT